MKHGEKVCEDSYKLSRETHSDQVKIASSTSCTSSWPCYSRHIAFQSLEFEKKKHSKASISLCKHRKLVPNHVRVRGDKLGHEVLTTKRVKWTNILVAFDTEHDTCSPFENHSFPEWLSSCKEGLLVILRQDGRKHAGLTVVNEAFSTRKIEFVITINIHAN